MILDLIVEEIAAEMPKMNKEVLYASNNRQLALAPEFIATSIEESSKFLGGLIRLNRHGTLDPETQIATEIRASKNKFRIPTTLSHIKLNEFVVDYGDGESKSLYLHTFYTHRNMLVFNGKRSAVFKCILEKTFSRVRDKQNDGISASPIRVHLLFGRKTVKEYTSVNSGYVARQFLITTRMYYGQMSKKFGETTVLHYLLAKFGFQETLKKFGLSRKDISFATTVDMDDMDHEYFLAQLPETSMSPLYLKVKNELLEDAGCRKLVVNLLYILSYFDLQTIDNVYEPDARIWKIMIGTITSGDINPLRALSSAQSHFASVDYFVDPITRDRFRTFGVDIDDIYDLLIYVFSYIDDITVNSEPQNLYTRRFDISKGILSEAYGKKIFRNMYDLSRKSNPTSADIKRYLRFPMSMYMMALPSGKSTDGAQYITRSPEIVGDNQLFSFLLTKVRLGGAPFQRLHPSVFVVESGCTFSGKTLNQTGAVNPYVDVDEHGGVIQPYYADEFDELVESIQSI